MCAYLGKVKSTFEVQDTDKDGWIRINLENVMVIFYYFYFFVYNKLTQYL